jgi:hypothetical protein
MKPIVLFLLTALMGNLAQGSVYDKFVDVEIARPQATKKIVLNGNRSYSVEGVFTVDTPTAKTYVAGTASVQGLTFAAKASTTNADYVVIYAADGTAYAVAADLTGASSAPTGAAWVAIPALQKTQVDISGATTAASVAALFETAFNSISGFTAKITTDDTAGSGAMSITQVVRGVTSAGVPHNAADSGAGSITVANTTTGVASTVDVTADTITITGHGLTTGLVGQLTSTSTLPAGSSTSTDYYVIVVNANTIKLASSLANALLGTGINLTNQGTNAATHTFTATALATASVKVECSNSGDNWFDMIAATNITATGNVYKEKVDPTCKFARVYFAIASGRISGRLHIYAQ